MTKTSTRSRSKKRPTATQPRKFPVWPVLVGAVVVAGILAVVFTAGSDDAANDSAENGTVTVSGDPLPQFATTQDDAAIGATAPTLTGTNFSDAPVTIPADDGNAKAIFFVAHWCSHCQAEVPRLAEWLRTNDLPAGVDIEIVSTAVDDNRGNYPPSAWLEREGVGDLPVIADDADSSANVAYGSGGLPYIVYLDKDHKVAPRTTGEYEDDPAIYTDLFDALAAGEPLQDPRAAG